MQGVFREMGDPPLTWRRSNWGERTGRAGEGGGRTRVVRTCISTQKIFTSGSGAPAVVSCALLQAVAGSGRKWQAADGRCFVLGLYELFVVMWPRADQPNKHIEQREVSTHPRGIVVMMIKDNTNSETIASSTKRTTPE